MVREKDAALIRLSGGKEYHADIITDSMGEKSVDITTLRKETGYITYDPGYVNTGSCMSSICYINGEKGILRYRGYDIADLVANCDFIEVAYLLIKGRLPTAEERIGYQKLLNENSLLHVNMRNFFRAYPHDGHPMGILAAMVASLSAFYPELDDRDPEENLDLTVTRLLSKMRTIAAFTYRQMEGLDFVEPQYSYSYCANFLNMMFHTSVNNYLPNPVHVNALNKLLILHADHEQNCSTSAVRLVGSSDANLYASVTAGVCALWGSKHGGANQAVMDMLQKIKNEGLSIDSVIEKAKSKDEPFRLFGFVMEATGVKDDLLDIALELEERATHDDYFIERNLYPNVDFYTGITFHMMGIPVSMFTVLFAMGRLPGWIAHYLEWRHDPYQKIGRPRQVYSGPEKMTVVPIAERR